MAESSNTFWNDIKGIMFGRSSKKEITKKVSPFDNFTFVSKFADGKVHNISVLVKLTRFDKMNLIFFCVGFLLFMLAPLLSRSITFHYASGVSVGLLMAWMIIIILLLRVVPFRKTFASVLVLSSSIGLFWTDYLIQSAKELIMKYPLEFTAYCFLMMLLTSALLYYYGPIENYKTMNIIQWTLQLIALYLIYLCSYYTDFSVTAVVATITTKVILNSTSVLKFLVPKKVYYAIQYGWFKPKTRFLTQEEYHLQGIVETKRALVELKEFCESPKCKSWELVHKVKDPKRFASFIKTGSHLSVEEIEEFEDFDPILDYEEHVWISDDNETDTSFRSRNISFMSDDLG